MRGTRLAGVLAIGLAAALAPAVGVADPARSCPDLSPPPLSFAPKRTIDTNRAGGEPVIIAAEDGSLNVSAHAGTTHLYKDPFAGPGYYDFLVGYANQTLNWRSDDGGNSWQYVGTAGLPQGPHSLTSTGFSDPDYAMDLGGRIYNVEIDLANVAVFSSDDDGQSYNLANPFVTAGDRPWVTGGEADEVYLYVNLPKQLWRSADAGITWELVQLDFPADGKLFRDPLDPENGLIGPVGTRGGITNITFSDDKGQTWRTPQLSGSGLPGGTQFFGTIAVDDAGNVYAVSAGGYSGPSDTAPNGQVSVNVFVRDPDHPDGGEWQDPVQLDTPDGDALWPWIVAGEEGRVALAWYQTERRPDGTYDPDTFHVYAAYSLNGTGQTPVTCDDGTVVAPRPAFDVVRASSSPIHVGDICLSGTTCNAATTPEGGDRRLGDFFSIGTDLAGRIVIATGDTTRPNPLGGPKPVGNPVFIGQDGGAFLRTTPIEPRPTRCLANLAPLCDLP